MIKLKSLIKESEENDIKNFLAFAKVTPEEVKQCKTLPELYKILHQRNPEVRIPRDESGPGENFFEVGPGGATHLSTLMYMNKLNDIFWKLHGK
jgi:hypothetical protein